MERAKGVYKNHTFFAERSLESVYWAGFILGDGSIRIDSRSNSATLSVHLTGSDSEHLDSMQKFLGGVRGDYKRYDKRYEKVRSVATLDVCSSQMVSDLDSIYGIVPKKTLIEKPPVGLSAQESLAFVAGLMDADGSYYVNAAKRPAMSLVGSEEVLRWASQVLFDRELTIHSTTSICIISASGDKAIKARQKMHDLNGLPLLPRKVDAWERSGANMHISGRKDNKIG